ncbi:MAG: hypothetical protein J6564_02575 [Gilliamella sp.]|uniref:hypothetical protein n=1 Tax=Gilliamella sp. TaxID=1891236 RepID=UPI0025DFFCA4|nr:hypothetical protein [Gilliamella sp.]MCO6544704.1 hypothetical protein [Gilliamella sp.]
MLKTIIYQFRKFNSNYKHFIVSIFTSFFHSFKKQFYKTKYILHYFVLCLFLMISHTYYANALTARTLDVIHGHAPYLSFDSGATKGEIQALLGIRLSDGREYVPEMGRSNLYPNAMIAAPDEIIELPSGAESFDSIQTLIPLSSNSSYPKINLRDIIVTNNYWVDDDGDNNVDMTGLLELIWYDVNSVDITNTIKNNPTSKFDPCSAPYQLHLKVRDAQLSTLYGEPKITNFGTSWSLGSASQTYILNPKISANEARICYAQPPGMYGMPGKNWNNLHGFHVNNINNPKDNFPTTGADNLSFYLLLTGITPQQVINANGTTVSAVSGGSSVNILLSAEKLNQNSNQNKLQLKITLKGPNKDSNNKNFNPSLFKLYADSNHNQLLYSFKLERWYIAKPDLGTDYNQAKNFCNGLGSNYRVPSVGDYTNANDGYSWMWGEPGQKNESLRQLSYQRGNRWIGGLFNEWGSFNTNISDWNFPPYWASESYQDKQYIIMSYGQIFLNNPDSIAGLACVTP